MDTQEVGYYIELHRGIEIFSMTRYWARIFYRSYSESYAVLGYRVLLF